MCPARVCLGGRDRLLSRDRRWGGTRLDPSSKARQGQRAHVGGSASRHDKANERMSAGAPQGTTRPTSTCRRKRVKARQGQRAHVGGSASRHDKANEHMSAEARSGTTRPTSSCRRERVKARQGQRAHVGDLRRDHQYNLRHGWSAPSVLRARPGSAMSGRFSSQAPLSLQQQVFRTPAAGRAAATGAGTIASTSTTSTSTGTGTGPRTRTTCSVY